MHCRRRIPGDDRSPGCAAVHCGRRLVPVMRRRIQLGLRCCCARKLRDCRRRGVHHAAAVAMHVARQHAAAHGDCVAGHLAPALDCKVEMAVRAEQHLVVAQAVHLGLGVVMDAAWVDRGLRDAVNLDHHAHWVWERRAAKVLLHKRRRHQRRAVFCHEAGAAVGRPPATVLGHHVYEKDVDGRLGAAAHYADDLERVVLERASEVLHTIQLVLEAERRARVLAADEAGGGDVGHELVVNKDACVHRVRERALAKQRVRHVDRQLDVAERAVALGRGLGQRLEAVHGPRVVGVLPLRVQSARAIQCKRAELRRVALMRNERRRQLAPHHCLIVAVAVADQKDKLAHPILPARRHHHYVSNVARCAAAGVVHFRYRLKVLDNHAVDICLCFLQGRRLRGSSAVARRDRRHPWSVFVH
mmetsp:Transcript_38695/g.114986  ORF Transcript_38695/g.114986 Transcript_38695/m.114986 type:complete len:416 (-) Transcript_38695:406-1653(-)